MFTVSYVYDLASYPKEVVDILEIRYNKLIKRVIVCENKNRMLGNNEKEISRGDQGTYH